MNRLKPLKIAGVLFCALVLLALPTGCARLQGGSAAPQELVLERSVSPADGDARPMAKLRVTLRKRYRGVLVEATYTNGCEYVLMPSMPQMLEVRADSSSVYHDEASSGSRDIPLPPGESRLWTADCDLPPGAENIQVSINDWYAVKRKGKPVGLQIGRIEVTAPLTAIPESQ